MKLLTEVYKKNAAGENLTKEELRFIYEIDHRIEGFGYEKDPRIAQIVESRAMYVDVFEARIAIYAGVVKEDYARMFDCTTDQIALHAAELDANTVVLLHDFTDLLTKHEELPESLRYIKGGLTLWDSAITSLRNVESVGGHVNLGEFVTDIGALRRVGGRFNAIEAPVTQLAHLEEVEGDMNIARSCIQDIGPLRFVGGSFDASGTQIVSLQQLGYVGGDVDLSNAVLLEDLGKLISINGDLRLQHTQVPSLQNIKDIAGALILKNTQIVDLGAVASVGRVDFSHAQVQDVGGITEVDDDLTIKDCAVTSLGNIEFVGGSVDINDSSIADLGALREVAGSFSAENTPLTTLGNLIHVGEFLNIKGTQIKYVGPVQYIGRGGIGNTPEVTAQIQAIMDKEDTPPQIDTNATLVHEHLLVDWAQDNPDDGLDVQQHRTL
jgi:hypothetical protein